jgi:hypothetical protein
MNKKVCSIFESRHYTLIIFAKAVFCLIIQAFLLPVFPIHRGYICLAKAGPLRKGE